MIRQTDGHTSHGRWTKIYQKSSLTFPMSTDELKKNNTFKWNWLLVWKFSKLRSLFNFYLHNLYYVLMPCYSFIQTNTKKTKKQLSGGFKLMACRSIGKVVHQLCHALRQRRIVKENNIRYKFFIVYFESYSAFIRRVL